MQPQVLRPRGAELMPETMAGKHLALPATGQLPMKLQWTQFTYLIYHILYPYYLVINVLFASVKSSICYCLKNPIGSVGR